MLVWQNICNLKFIYVGCHVCWRSRRKGSAPTSITRMSDVRVSCVRDFINDDIHDRSCKKMIIIMIITMMMMMMMMMMMTIRLSCLKNCIMSTNNTLAEDEWDFVQQTIVTFKPSSHMSVAIAIFIYIYIYMVTRMSIPAHSRPA